MRKYLRWKKKKTVHKRWRPKISSAGFGDFLFSFIPFFGTPKILEAKYESAVKNKIKNCGGAKSKQIVVEMEAAGGERERRGSTTTVREERIS